MTLMEPEQRLAWANPDGPETKKRTQAPQQGPRGPIRVETTHETGAGPGWAARAPPQLDSRQCTVQGKTPRLVPDG